MKKIKIKRSLLPVILNLIQICVYVAGIVLTLLICSKVGSRLGTGNWPSLNVIADWAEIIIAYAAIFAIGQYIVAYNEIRDRKTREVLELVKFFREHVIILGNKIRKFENENKQDSIPRILLRKNTPALNFTEEEFFTRINPNQRDNIKKYINQVHENFDIEDLVLGCLNAGEEFAIGVLNSNSQDHVGVSSIKKPFIIIIEELAVPLYYHIGILEDSFPYLSTLYRHWKKEVGFIPYVEEDKLARYKEREGYARKNKWIQ